MDLFPIILVIHLLLAVALVGVVLLQRSEGGALGIGGGGNVLSGRAAGNLLTRTTAILAGAFFLTSLGLAMIANSRNSGGSIFDQVPASSAPATSGKSAPSTGQPAEQPAKPSAPSAPLAR